jgi:hypothetical protein
VQEKEVAFHVALQKSVQEKEKLVKARSIFCEKCLQWEIIFIVK